MVLFSANGLLFAAVDPLVFYSAHLFHSPQPELSDRKNLTFFPPPPPLSQLFLNSLIHITAGRNIHTRALIDQCCTSSHTLPLTQQSFSWNDRERSLTSVTFGASRNCLSSSPDDIGTSFANRISLANSHRWPLFTLHSTSPISRRIWTSHPSQNQQGRTANPYTTRVAKMASEVANQLSNTKLRCVRFNETFIPFRAIF